MSRMEGEKIGKRAGVVWTWGRHSASVLELRQPFLEGESEMHPCWASCFLLQDWRVQQLGHSLMVQGKRTKEQVWRRIQLRY